MKSYDLVVIGSGAGLIVLEAALSTGLSCAIVEKSKFGGTCLNKGCIPSKMLAYPADLIRSVQKSDEIGVNLGKPGVDWDKVSKRVWAQIDQNKLIEKGLKKVNNLDVYHTPCAFTSPTTLSLEKSGDFPGGEIYGRNFVVAAGARPFVPSIVGLEETGYLTYESFFGEKYPKKLWKSVIVIGGGAVGAEFVHIFSAFGVKVSLVEIAKTVVPTEEEEISSLVEKTFLSNGVEVYTSHKAISASVYDGQKQLEIQDIQTGKVKKITADEIFIAAGVRSNADRLSASLAGIAMDGRGYIVTNEYLETNINHIYAIGDINGKYQFRHKANYEAEVLVNNLFTSGEKKKASYDAVPWAIFTSPQVGHVGITEKQAKEKGLKVRTGKNYYSSVAAGIAMGAKDKNDGFIKIVAGEDKKILGAHIVGPESAVLVQPFAYLMNAGFKCGAGGTGKQSGVFGGLFGKDEKRLEYCRQAGTLNPILDSMAIHPSLNELVAWAPFNIDWSD